MILRIILASAILALPAAAQSVTDAQRASIEKAVLEASAKITLAAESQDTDAMFALIAENDKGSVIQNGALQLTRAEALSQVRQGMQALTSVKYRWGRRYVTVLSPTIALLVAEGEFMAVTQSGATVQSPFAQTNVFVLKDGQWKILHGHHSTVQQR